MVLVATHHDDDEVLLSRIAAVADNFVAYARAAPPDCPDYIVNLEARGRSGRSLLTAQSELGQRRELDIVKAESVHLRPAARRSLRSIVCPGAVTSLSFPRSANTVFRQSVMAITWAVESAE